MSLAPYDGLSSLIDFVALPAPDERFDMGDMVGEGTYGEVYRAMGKTSCEKVSTVNFLIHFAKHGLEARRARIESCEARVVPRRARL